jgi:hypothetical protein
MYGFTIIEMIGTSPIAFLIISSIQNLYKFIRFFKYAAVCQFQIFGRLMLNIKLRSGYWFQTPIRSAGCRKQCKNSTFCASYVVQFDINPK